MAKKDEHLTGLSRVIVAPPTGIYLRYMGRYTAENPNEKGRAYVTHLRGLGCVVKGSLEDFIVKQKIIEVICETEDPRVLEVLRQALAGGKPKRQSPG